MPINVDSSAVAIYSEFRRIVQLWNDTRDANRVNELYEEIFRYNPQNYNEADLVGDVFHFVSNLDGLGPHRVRMPTNYNSYTQEGGVDAIMDTSDIPEEEEEPETDMEGDGRKYPNPFKRFRPIRVQPINRKPDYNYCCGSGVVQIVNPKFLPF